MVGGRACSATVCFRPHQLPQPPGAAYPTKQHLISLIWSNPLMEQQNDGTRCPISLLPTTR